MDQKYSSTKIFAFFEWFENSKFSKTNFHLSWKNTFFKKKRDLIPEKPHVDGNSKAWNGKEFDFEVEEKSIPKSYHRMSDEKRFVFILDWSFLRRIFEQIQCLGLFHLFFQQNDYADILIIALFKLMTDLLTRPSLISALPFIKIEFTIVIY